MRPIGYYFHHHGIGHWQRANALAGLLRRPCTLLGTVAPGQAERAICPVVALPDDAGALDGGGVPGLHYAPLGHDGLRRRTAQLAGWIAEARPALIIVDVSVETALLSRLCSTAFVYFRLAGRRDDAPHLATFRAAQALIAPYPDSLEAEDVEDWVREKTFHAGFLAAPPTAPSRDSGDIVVIFGQGGPGGDSAALAAAAQAVPDRLWRVLGPVTPPAGEMPPNLEFLGWRDDAPALLADAGIVIGAGGDGLMAEVAALGKRFICIPEARPYGEQRAKAIRLHALGAAITREAWPEADAWPCLIAQAAGLDPRRIAALYDPGALRQTAAFIDGIADLCDQ